MIGNLPNWLVLVVLTLSIAPIAQAADAWISIEVVFAGRNDPTAHRDWMKLLSEAGADSVRIRSANRGDEPTLDETGTEQRPRYALVGVLNDRGQLTLPGGRFDLRSSGKLRDYFERLAADGSDGVTAERGAYGLTREQTTAMTEDLSQLLGKATAGVALADVLKNADAATKYAIRMDDNVWRLVQMAEPVADDVQMLTVGTALALMLKRDGLVLVPTKPQGQPLHYRVARREAVNGEVWPVGWKPDRSPGELAPATVETINAEVAGFTLAEAMESIEPRLGLPVFWDHATLQSKQIDPEKVHVKLPRQRSRLGRVVDRLLFQARLRGVVKVDEAGTPFYWISR